MDRVLLDALLSHLSQSAKVPREVWSSLLALTGEQERGYVASLAREVRERNFGGGVYVRALLEITSYCRNGCRYFLCDENGKVIMDVEGWGKNSLERFKSKINELLKEMEL